MMRGDLSSLSERKRPSGPASVLLRIVARDPQVVAALNENATLAP